MPCQVMYELLKGIAEGTPPSLVAAHLEEYREEVAPSLAYLKAKGFVVDQRGALQLTARGRAFRNDLRPLLRHFGPDGDLARFQE